jgi:Glycosyl hydrolase family 20, catalytic domain
MINPLRGRPLHHRGPGDRDAGARGAAILAYPELGKDRVFNVENSTIRMLKNVLDEVLELFPSKFIHIGGDEVSKLPWKSDPRPAAYASGRFAERGGTAELVHQAVRFVTDREGAAAGWLG